MIKGNFFIIIFLILVKCTSASISIDSDISLDEKLQYTEWSTKSFTRKNSITFTRGYLKLQVGSLLGTSDTPTDIILQESDFVLYQIFTSQSPTLLGIVQIDQNTIKVLWGQTALIANTSSEIKNILNERGQTFKLRRHIQQ